MAKVELPREGAFDTWRSELLTKLRRMSFHDFPERIPAARHLREADHVSHLSTEPGIAIRLRALRAPATLASRVLVVVTASSVDMALPAWLEATITEKDAVYVCEPRGIGASQWTRKNPPNYVERSHYLLGRTVDSGRVWDIAATARYLRALHKEQSPIQLVGESAEAVLAIYAALLESEIAGLILHQPSATHMDDSAPALLNVLRVCDIPEALGMVAPRPVTLIGGQTDWAGKATAIYRAAGATDRLVLQK
jgi:hypothetical protein